MKNVVSSSQWQTYKKRLARAPPPHFQKLSLSSSHFYILFLLPPLLEIYLEPLNVVILVEIHSLYMRGSKYSAKICPGLFL